MRAIILTPQRRQLLQYVADHPSTPRHPLARRDVGGRQWYKVMTALRDGGLLVESSTFTLDVTQLGLNALASAEGRK